MTNAIEQRHTQRHLWVDSLQTRYLSEDGRWSRQISSLVSAARHSARPRSSPFHAARSNSTKPTNESLEEAQKKAKEALSAAQKQGAKAWETAKAYSGPVQGFLQTAAKQAGPVAKRVGESLGPLVQRLGPAGQKTVQFFASAWWILPVSRAEADRDT